MTTVVAFNGSPRPEGNTSILIGQVLQELEKEGITTELVQVGGKKIRGCTACMKCFENRDRRCVFDDDIVNDCIGKMAEADGIILGSPVYFTDVTAEMKALIDRAGLSRWPMGACSGARWDPQPSRSAAPGLCTRSTRSFISC
jgi:multimeric flavodoxin WrbA